MKENFWKSTSQEIIIALSFIVGFAWGGVIIGWWIAYPLGQREVSELCREK